MAQTTRTLNPLPLGDLEPHRFEDLVRQLAYDFRRWRALEAIGRSGADEGIDIRGIEAPASGEPTDERSELDDDGGTDLEGTAPIGERVWVFQCKRGKSIGPAKVRSIVADFFAGDAGAPYGYVLAAACDFSKAARDELRTALRERGVSEIHMWGRGELEDQLFQPKNDHLLFAYFGISVQVRRASVRTTLRSRVVLKRKLVKELGAIDQLGHALVLIRDPKDGSYPHVINAEQFVKAPAWRYYQFYAHDLPDHLTFITKKFFAYGNYDTGEWDYMEGLNVAAPRWPAIFGIDDELWHSSTAEDICRAYWELNVPAQYQCWLLGLRRVHYDRILAYDEIGDALNAGPHLCVDYREDDPFEPESSACIQPAEPYASWVIHPKGPADPKRIAFFPKELTDERERWRAEQKKKLDGMTGR